MEEGLIAALLALTLAQAPAPPANEGLGAQPRSGVSPQGTRAGIHFRPEPPKEAALWDKLRARLRLVDERLDGVLAVSVEDLASGRTIEMRAAEPFAAASCIKPAVLLELYHAAAAGSIDLQQPVPLTTPRVGGGGPLELLGAGARLTWRDLAEMTMAYSDNDAANALIDRLGMEAVNARLRGLGLTTTQLRRRLMDGAAAREGRENVSSANELRALMKAVRAGAGLPAPLADDLRAVVAGPKRSEFEVPLPDGPRILAKTGFIEGVRCWVAVVELPHRPFAAAVMAGHLRRDSDGEAAVREIAAETLATFQRLALDSEYGRSRMRE